MCQKFINSTKFTLILIVISTINLRSCYATGITTDYIHWKNQHCKWGEGALLQIFCGGLRHIFKRKLELDL